MKAKIISYPCKGWCLGKVGDMKPCGPNGVLVCFNEKCPHKTENTPNEKTRCFFEDKLSKIEILDD